MKKTIQKLLFFLLPLLGCYLLVSFIPVNYNSRYLLSSEVNTIFVGDSHIRYGIDPTILNAANYGVNSQSMLFTYYVTKRLVTLNNQISCVVIGLAPHNIVHSHNRFSDEAYAKYSHLFSLSEKWHLLIMGGKIKNYLKFIKFFFVEKFNSNGYSFNRKQLKIPNLNTETANNEANFERRIRFQFYENNAVNAEITPDAVYYNKLKFFLQSKGIQLLFLNTPTFEKYHNKIPHCVTHNFFHFVEKNKLPFKDYSHFHGFEKKPINFTQDGDHLSSIGANKFAKLLKDELPCF